MNPEKLKECIRIAKEAVKDESEPYKTEGYKIILEKLLNNITDIKKPSDNSKKDLKNKENKKSITELDEGKKELATNCKISLDELEDVVFINANNDVEIIAPIKGGDTKKHIIVALCVLAASEFILKEEWIESPKIAECLRSIGVKDITNLSFTLKRYSSLIRTTGSRGVHKKYRLTSNEGRKQSFEVIRALAKGEDPEI